MLIFSLSYALILIIREQIYVMLLIYANEQKALKERSLESFQR